MTADRSSMPLTCEICQGSPVEPWCTNRDFLSEEAFAIVRCRQCGVARTLFPHPLEELARYYGKPYYGESGRRFFAPVEWAIERFRNGRARLVMRMHPTPGRVLDVGCGRALMLGQLKGRGWRCEGTEISEDMAAWARDRHQIEVRSEELDRCGFEPGTFDVITLWHSLEHMANPLAVLREAARILKPGGHLILEVPNLESLQAAIGKGRWFHLDAPRHQFHFGRRQIRGLLEEIGLDPGYEGTTSLELGFYGMWQTLLNLVTFRPNVLYLALRRFRPDPGSERRSLTLVGHSLWDWAMSALLLAPVLLLGSGLEAAACLAGRGGIVRVAARKRSAVKAQPNGREAEPP